MKISREAKIGALVIISIALFIWGYNFLKGNNILKSSTSYYGVYDSIVGLKKAAPIYLNGYKIGIVDDIQMSKTPPNDIIVQFSMKEKISIPEDSKALIVSDGLLGSMAIELKLGKSGKIMEYGDTIQSRVPSGMLDMVVNEFDNIASRIDSVLLAIQLILDEETTGNVKQMVSDLASTANTLEQNKHNITMILTNIETFTRSLKSKEKEIENILNNFSSLSDSIADSEIKPVISNANSAIVEASKLINQINSGEGTVGLLMNDSSLYNNLSDASKSLDSLLIDLKENPSRYVHISVFGKKDD